MSSLLTQTEQILAIINLIELSNLRKQIWFFLWLFILHRERTKVFNNIKIFKCVSNNNRLDTPFSLCYQLASPDDSSPSSSLILDPFPLYLISLSRRRSLICGGNCQQFDVLKIKTTWNTKCMYMYMYTIDEGYLSNVM